jgi:hypothetical protein
MRIRPSVGEGNGDSLPISCCRIELRENPPGQSVVYAAGPVGDAFQAKLLAYNRRYTPPHVPELLLNTAARLGKWCQTMRDLYRLIEPDPSSHCPGGIVEKAYCWADRIARRTNRSLVSAQASPRFVCDAIAELESLGRRCAAGIR